MHFINANQLEKLIDKNKNLVIINVLSKESFEQEHIPGSINIDVSDHKFVEHVKNKYPNREQQIVVYCASQECPASTDAAKQLENVGYNEVMDFKGGMADWKAAGKSVESGAVTRK